CSIHCLACRARSSAAKATSKAIVAVSTSFRCAKCSAPSTRHCAKKARTAKKGWSSSEIALYGHRHAPAGQQRLSCRRRRDEPSGDARSLWEEGASPPSGSRSGPRTRRNANVAPQGVRYGKESYRLSQIAGAGGGRKSLAADRPRARSARSQHHGVL